MEQRKRNVVKIIGNGATYHINIKEFAGILQTAMSWYVSEVKQNIEADDLPQIYKRVVSTEALYSTLTGNIKDGEPQLPISDSLAVMVVNEMRKQNDKEGK